MHVNDCSLTNKKGKGKKGEKEKKKQIKRAWQWSILYNFL